MRKDYLTLVIVCTFLLLILGASGRRNWKSHNDVITKNYDNRGKGRNRTKQKPARWSTYSRLYHYLLKREKPWLLLPNDNSCMKNWCSNNDECCRGYNICDVSAKVCRDCWWGSHCRSSANCCEKFPICEKESGEEYGKCVNVD